MTPPAAGDVAWAWVEHLRSGGATPWRQWAGSGPATTPVPAAPDLARARAAERLPGAAQLELVRRLARRQADRPVSGLDFAALADLVLARPGPGRGRPDLPLAWPDGTEPVVPEGYGAPAVDPGRVPPTELVRVGVGVLADLLADPEADAHRGRSRPRRRWFSPTYRLAGAPVSVRQVRRALVADGRRPGGRNPTVLVLAAPLDDALQQTWVARAVRGSEARWGKYVLRLARTDRLPAAADPSRAAQRWARQVGADRVHVLVGRHDDPAVRRTAAEVLGLPIPEDAPATGPTTAAEADVVRRLNAVLAVRLPRRRHRAVLRRSLPDLFDGAPHPPLALPEACRDWARRHSAGVAERLAAGGYAVHGDLEEVTRLRPGTVGRPQPARVLDATLTACLRAAARQQERDRGRTTR